MPTTSDDDLPPAPGLLLVDLADHLYSVGPILGHAKARKVAESVMILIMKYYVKEAQDAERNGDD